LVLSLSIPRLLLTFLRRAWDKFVPPIRRTPSRQQYKFLLLLSQNTKRTLFLMWPANFANDASSNGLLSLTSLSHTLPISNERLSIIAHYPSVAIRAAWSGLQSVLVHRMRWASHHLFRSYELQPYKWPICSRDTLIGYKDNDSDGQIVSDVKKTSSFFGCFKKKQ